jgi:hypothetical protein
VKENGSLATLISDGSQLAPSCFVGYWYYAYTAYSARISDIAIYPDGSGIAVAYRGNWNGGPTPTPNPVPPGFDTPTPVPLSYWRQSALYKVTKDGSLSTISEGGALNPPISSFRGTAPGITSVAVDQSGNIYVNHYGYQYPAPTPVGQAILKVSQSPTEGKGAVTIVPFVSPWNASFPDALVFQGSMTVDPDGNLLVVKNAHFFIAGPGTPVPVGPTPIPAAIYKVDPAGVVTQLAAATAKTWQLPGWPGPRIWSEPFDEVWFVGFDIQGNTVFNADWFDSSVSEWNSRLLSAGPGGVTVLGDNTLGWWADCIGDDGS